MKGRFTNCGENSPDSAVRNFRVRRPTGMVGSSPPVDAPFIHEKLPTEGDPMRRRHNVYKYPDKSPEEVSCILRASLCLPTQATIPRNGPLCLTTQRSPTVMQIQGKRRRGAAPPLVCSALRDIGDGFQPPSRRREVGLARSLNGRPTRLAMLDCGYAGITNAAFLWSVVCLLLVRRAFGGSLGLGSPDLGRPTRRAHTDHRRSSEAMTEMGAVYGRSFGMLEFP
uniref:Uncharacterized protein n=1 Tax=Trichuris muris TaxID=70415 RepID=A0A5S6Q843_TRIMR